MRLHYTLDEISISKGGKYFINWRGLMKQFLIITTLVFYSLMLATCNSASDKLSKNNIIHENKAANLKANFAKHASGLKKYESKSP